jgi:hypothetical protein
MKFSFMKARYLLLLLIVPVMLYTAIAGLQGCAQIGMPTGGPKDSIPPVLVRADPAERSLRFTGNKITLTFNEYIDVQDAQNNVLVSPYPKSNPQVSFKLRTVTVKLKDSLLPNTTYAIDFGTSLRDLNEGNPFRNYTYIFSTGNQIDSLSLSGNIYLAETGKTDSTLMVFLYKDADDTVVIQRKPDFVARTNGQGAFRFSYLSPGSYRLFALKDGDGSKTYNTPVEVFAFAGEAINISDSTQPVTLYAYAEEKEIPRPAPVATTGKVADRKLRYSSTLSSGERQGLKSPLELQFNYPLHSIDSTKVLLTDTAYRNIAQARLSTDSTGKILRISLAWAEDTEYRLLLNREGLADSTGARLFKNDTLRFRTKMAADYGNLLLRFPGADSAQHPVLLLYKAETLVQSIPVINPTWSDPRFDPGEYELRVLFDDNRNGRWDPGNFRAKRQPERVITLPRKLAVRANWDNDQEIQWKTAP